MKLDKGVHPVLNERGKVGNERQARLLKRVAVGAEPGVRANSIGRTVSGIGDGKPIWMWRPWGGASGHEGEKE